MFCDNTVKNDIRFILTMFSCFLSLYTCEKKLVTKEKLVCCGHHKTFFYIVLVLYMDSALNMDTPNIFKSNKFYRHLALRARKEKQLKR